MVRMKSPIATMDGCRLHFIIIATPCQSDKRAQKRLFSEIIEVSLLVMYFWKPVIIAHCFDPTMSYLQACDR